MRRAIRSAAASILVMGTVVLAPAEPALAAVTITEFPVASPNGPGPITGSTTGYVWFTEPSDDTIGRISAAGVVTEYGLPTTYEDPRGITDGPDGAVWFTQSGGHTGAEGIGRIDASGTITEFPLADGTGPYGITTGPNDGNLWFTETAVNWTVAKITTAGTITEFPLDLHNRPLNIVAGPDGALWFTEDGIVWGGTGAIGRITTSGSLTEYELPTPDGYDSGAGDIAVGPDGNLWFTWTSGPPGGLGNLPWARSIGRITPSGTITEFPISTTNGWPGGGITAGPDGALWFTTGAANTIGRITTTGTVTHYPVPTSNSFPVDIDMGPDGNLWFTEGYASKIGRLSLSTSGVPTPMISAFSPTSGPVGTTVTILGANFAGATSVAFGGVNQPVFSVDVTGTQITATVPSGAATGLLSVTTPFGTATSGTAYTVTVPSHPREITLRLPNDKAKGSVLATDGFAACAAQVHVIVQRRDDEGWRNLASLTTDDIGAYRTDGVTRPGTYRAVAKRVTLTSGDLCLRAVSEVVRQD